MEIVELRPKLLHMITPHIRLFTLPDRPTPCIYNSGCCHRMLQELVYRVCVNGEPDDPLLRVKVYRGNAKDVRRLIEHVYSVYPDYSEFLECIKVFQGYMKLHVSTVDFVQHLLQVYLRR